MLRTTIAITSTTLVLAASCLAAPQAASATELRQSQMPQIESWQWTQAMHEFESTKIPRDTRTDGWVKSTTFHFDKGFTLTFSVPTDDLEGTGAASARLGIGRMKYGNWFSFNQFDQDVLSNAVAATALTSAICLIPGVGFAACAVAGLVVSIGISYIHKHGVCSKNRQMYLYDVRGGSVVECRASAPK